MKAEVLLYFKSFYSQCDLKNNNNRQRQAKGKSRIDNPEKLATLGTQDIGRRQAKQKRTQHSHSTIKQTQIT